MLYKSAFVIIFEDGMFISRGIRADRLHRIMHGIYGSRLADFPVYESRISARDGRIF
jgi:hypothetical protein